MTQTCSMFPIMFSGNVEFVESMNKIYKEEKVKDIFCLTMVEKY